MVARSLAAAACLLAGADAFSIGFSVPSSPALRAPAALCGASGSSRASVPRLDSRSAHVAGRTLGGLRAQEKGTDDKGLVDKIAGKGIWQIPGMSKEARDAVAKVGWADEEEEVADMEGERVKELPRFEREDIEGLVAKAVNAEIFADDRSKEVRLCFFT